MTNGVDPRDRDELEALTRRLAEHLGELTTQLAKQRRRDRRWMVVTAAVLLGMTATGTVAAVDARAQDRAQSQRWCELLDTITVPVPTAAPQTPATERQRKVIAQLTKLSEDFDCANR
jgi:hypothetical protein